MTPCMHESLRTQETVSLQPIASQTAFPVPRRTFLAASGLGLMASSAVGTNRASSAGQAKSTIFIYLSGGPSHIDLWDMKPKAPREYRGPFEPIATASSEIALCEHLPFLARQTNHLALVRSLGQRNPGQNDHGAGRYYVMTGHAPGPSFVPGREPSPEDWPFIGSVVSSKRPTHGALPSLVWLPTKSGPDNTNNPGAFAARLDVEHNPFFVQGSHQSPREFRSPSLTLEADVTSSRLRDRRAILAAVDAARSGWEDVERIQKYSRLEHKAFSLLTSPETRNAFDVMQEPDSVRSRYGETVNGLSYLIARRLVEAEVPFITLHWLHDYEEDKRRGCLGGAWDTHWKNFSCLRDYLLPQFDQPFAALLADLHERGLLDQTLIVVTAEMGRTPKIGDPRSGGDGAAEPGRDHWTHCQTALLAGGGIRGGQVYGSSDKIGAYPADKPVGPEHIAHTVYHAMGIDDLKAIDLQGRPFHLLDEGEALVDLF